jgi:hypothetical protein
VQCHQELLSEMLDVTIRSQLAFLRLYGKYYAIAFLVFTQSVLLKVIIEF